MYRSTADCMCVTASCVCMHCYVCPVCAASSRKYATLVCSMSMWHVETQHNLLFRLQIQTYSARWFQPCRRVCVWPGSRLLRSSFPNPNQDVPGENEPEHTRVCLLLLLSLFCSLSLSWHYLSLVCFFPSPSRSLSFSIPPMLTRHLSSMCVRAVGWWSLY